MKIVLQSRDLKILKYVFESRVASYSQIKTRFFQNNKGSASRRRIKALVDVGILETDYKVARGVAVKCVSLTVRGFGHISETELPPGAKCLLRSESMEHDLIANDVRSSFEKMSIFYDYKTENMLQSYPDLSEALEYRDLGAIQADGALKMKDREGNEYLYAIEFENSKKTIERYQNKLSAYYQAGAIDGVIYVCGTNEIRSLIARVDKSIRTTPNSIVYLGLLEDVVSTNARMFFQNVEKQGIKFY